MQEDAKRPAHESQTAIDNESKEPHQEAIPWKAHHKYVLCEARRYPRQPYAIGRTAHDSVKDDDVGGRNSLGLLENIRHTECAPVLEALLLCEFPGVRLVGGDELDDLPSICACPDTENRKRRRARLSQDV